LFESNKTKQQYNSAYETFLAEDVQEQREIVATRMQDPWKLNDDGTVTITINESSITVSLRQWDFLKESISFNNPFEEEVEKYEDVTDVVLNDKTSMRDMLDDITASDNNYDFPADYFQEQKTSLKQLLDDVMQDQEEAE